MAELSPAVNTNVLLHPPPPDPLPLLSLFLCLFVDSVELQTSQLLLNTEEQTNDWSEPEPGPLWGTAGPHHTVDNTPTVWVTPVLSCHRSVSDLGWRTTSLTSNNRQTLSSNISPSSRLSPPSTAISVTYFFLVSRS